MKTYKNLVVGSNGKVVEVELEGFETEFVYINPETGEKIKMNFQKIGGHFGYENPI